MPPMGSTSAERYYAFAIGSAKKRLFITNSYFVPDDDFRRLLRYGRGVDTSRLLNEIGFRPRHSTVAAVQDWVGRHSHEAAAA